MYANVLSLQCCRSGSRSGRIRTFFVGSGSGFGRLGTDLDPDPDPGLNKSTYINLLGVCKNQKYLRNLYFLTFWVMNILFRADFCQKDF
jgi:hypothetical protein